MKTYHIQLGDQYDEVIAKYSNIEDRKPASYLKILVRKLIDAKINNDARIASDDTTQQPAEV